MRFELTQHFCHYPLKVACLPIPPPGHGLRNAGGFRAKNGTRTRDPDLGKVVLYQLSYFRVGQSCFAIAVQSYALFSFLPNFLAIIFYIISHYLSILLYYKLLQQYAKSNSIIIFRVLQKITTFVNINTNINHITYNFVQ